MLCTLRVTTRRKNSTQITQMERICTDLKNWRLHCAYTPFSRTGRRHSVPFSLSLRAVFVVIPSEARNPVHGCFTTLRCVQHDRLGALQNTAVLRTFSVIPSTFFLSFRAIFFGHSEQCEESSAWMRRFAQHDRTESVVPSESEESISDVDNTVQSKAGVKLFMRNKMCRIGRDN